MVEQAERALDSSGPELARMEIRLTRARKPDAPPNAQPHEELVNIGDDAASVDNFLKRWGQVDAPLKTENVEDGGEKHTVIRVRHPLWDRSGLEVGYRNALRGAWVSDPKLLEEFAGPPPYRNAPSALIFIYEQARLYNKTRWLFANGDDGYRTVCGARSVCCFFAIMPRIRRVSALTRSAPIHIFSGSGARKSIVRLAPALLMPSGDIRCRIGTEKAESAGRIYLLNCTAHKPSLVVPLVLQPPILLHLLLLPQQFIHHVNVH